MESDVETVSAVIDHVVAAVVRAPLVEQPFWHLELENVFPEALYRRMRKAMPQTGDYRALKGRGNVNVQTDGSSTRVKIDLFPEYLRHLPPEMREVWGLVGAVLRSPEVREAFMERLAPGLRQRFGADFMDVGMFPVPMLTRDVAGYEIAPHPDTRWKGITIQFYLPEDERIAHVGTQFLSRAEDGGFREEGRMSFLPNTGYAFAVGQETWHAVERLGPEVASRDSILHTYFLDNTPLLALRNRGKRAGNFLLKELRHVGR